MIGVRPARVAGGDDEDESSRNGGLGKLVEWVLREWRVDVSAAGDVHDADAEPLVILEDPFEPSEDVVLLDPASHADLDEDEGRLGREASIASSGEGPVARRDDRRLRPMPEPDLRILVRGEAGSRALRVVMGDDASGRCGEVRVREETRIEKSHRDATAGEALVGVEPLRDGDDRIVHGTQCTRSVRRSRPRVSPFPKP